MLFNEPNDDVQSRFSVAVLPTNRNDLTQFEKKSA
jgi:hypothetical protein